MATERKRYRKTTAEQKAERDAADRAMRALLVKCWVAYGALAAGLPLAFWMGWLARG